MPNIIATGAIVPAVPLDATRASSNRLVVPETQVVAPPPEVEFARDRVVQSAMKSDIIAPPPELTQSTKGHVGLLNIGPSDIVAPAPQLTLAEQHSLAARGKGRVPGGGVVPVAPPPSMAGARGSNSGGRLVALGIHPVAPSGPVVVPGGNRRGTFSAGPQGKAGASGTPELTGSKLDAKNAGGFGTHTKGSLPAGLYVGGADDAHEMAGLSTAGTAAGGRSKGRVASPVSDDKITDLDRQVFGGRRPYTTPLNMPNLNSSSGSWEIRFAELDAGRKEKEGDLVAPLATEQSDPGYPLELMRANVQGMVTLYAVIHSDGKVGEIRVLNSPDDRLDSYAARALARWKFAPAERGGKPVAIEALVKIPFRVRRNF
jgi:TonB family protein